MEISRRDLPITQDRIYGVTEQFQIQSAQTARFFWYRERDVLKYVEFVN